MGKGGAFPAVQGYRCQKPKPASTSRAEGPRASGEWGNQKPNPEAQPRSEEPAASVQEIDGYKGLVSQRGQLVCVLLCLVRSQRGTEGLVTVGI